MSSDLRDLYQEVILDHGKNPRNFKPLEEATHTAEGDNPLCGDQITLFIKTDGDKVIDAAFQGSGCAISKASASMMTTEIKGKTLSEVDTLFHGFKDMVTRDKAQEFDPGKLGKLGVFVGVCEFPSRVKCATLSWHTLHAALEGDGEVSTED